MRSQSSILTGIVTGRRWPARSLPILLAVLVAVAALAMLVRPVQAATLTVCASGCDQTTIQAAINAAASGDTITVQGGTYDEQLDVTKGVTIAGAGIGQAILQPSANNNDWDVHFTTGASSATLEGFTLDFNGVADDRGGRGIGVSDFNGPTVENVTVQNNDIQMGVGEGASTVGLEGVGLQTGRDADVDGLLITGNVFHGDPTDTGNGNNNGAEGIYVNPNAGSGSVTISNNTFDQHLFVGVSIEAGNVSVTGNTITRASGADVSNTHGVRVNDFVGNVTYNSITISNNTISGFENGLRLGSAADNGSTLNISAADNVIQDNTVRGVWVRHDAHVTVSQNQIQGNGTGIEILSGSDGAVTVQTPPEPPPTPTPTPTLTVSDPTGVTVEVENQIEVSVVADASTEVKTTGSDGSTAAVSAPAGALPQGATIKVATIAHLPELVTQAPPSAAEVVLGFVFEAEDSNGNPITEFSDEITLEFNIPAGSVPEGATSGTLVVAFWNGSSWTEVETALTLNTDGSYTIIAKVSHFTIFSVLHQPTRGTFTVAPVQGVWATVWNGGSYAAMESQIGSGNSVWGIVDGRWFGYTGGAPAFSNANFRAAFGENSIPGSTPLIVSIR